MPLGSQTSTGMFRLNEEKSFSAYSEDTRVHPRI